MVGSGTVPFTTDLYGDCWPLTPGMAVMPTTTNAVTSATKVTSTVANSGLALP